MTTPLKSMFIVCNKSFVLSMGRYQAKNKKGGAERFTVLATTVLGPWMTCSFSTHLFWTAEFSEELFPISMYTLVYLVLKSIGYLCWLPTYRDRQCSAKSYSQSQCIPWSIWCLSKLGTCVGPFQKYFPILSCKVLCETIPARYFI